MRTRPVLALALLAGITALALGCSKNNPTAPQNNTSTGDAAEVTATLAAAGTLVDDSLAENSTVNSATDAQPGRVSPAAAIRPFTWWQHVTHETISWSFAFTDTDSTGRPATCIATLQKHMTGQLVIIPVSPTDSTRGDTTRITKTLDKTLTRKVLLKRLALSGRRAWKVTEITGAFVTTPAAATHIVSLRIQSASGVDTTITDPLGFHALRHIVKFGTLDSVTVTVTTTRANDAVFIHRWDWRHRLRNNLDNTYSFTWVTSAWSGWRHFGIQAMSHGSLYDDTLPFDSEAWHLPFRVSGGQADVDYYP